MSRIDQLSPDRPPRSSLCRGCWSQLHEGSRRRCARAGVSRAGRVGAPRRLPRRGETGTCASATPWSVTLPTKAFPTAGAARYTVGLARRSRREQASTPRTRPSCSHCTSSTQTTSARRGATRASRASERSHLRERGGRAPSSSVRSPRPGAFDRSSQRDVAQRARVARRRPCPARRLRSSRNGLPNVSTADRGERCRGSAPDPQGASSRLGWASIGGRCAGSAADCSCSSGSAAGGGGREGETGGVVRSVRYKQGRPLEAIEWCRQAIDGVTSEEGRDALAQAFFVLDWAYASLGRYDEAVYSDARSPSTRSSATFAAGRSCSTISAW